MSKQIADFLIELSKNPLLVEQFKKDRLQAISAAGFTGREAGLLTISDVRTWFENFAKMRLQDAIEPGGEAFDAEVDIPMDEPLGEGKKKPPRTPKKRKIPRKPAKKISKKSARKITKKPAKKKKGGRK